MTVASLAAQFSDVERGPLDILSDSVPPNPVGASSGLRETRMGQSIWACADVTNSSLADAYLVVRPLFRSSLPEFLGSGLMSPVKRLDVVGAPSPAGTSISVMLAEVWRFFVPAGESRNYTFFVPSEGRYMYCAAWATDVAGVVIPAVGSITGNLWTAVGAMQAVMQSPLEGDA